MQITASCSVAAPAPTITSISPNTGPTTGNTDIVIAGTNLTGTTSVTVGGVAATNFTVVSATTVTARTPAGAAGAKDVVVTTPGGSVTSTGGFTHIEAPSITSHPSNSTIAAGANTTFSVAALDATGYQWQVNSGSGFTNISDGGVYSGATTATLTITNATAGMNGYLYRVVVTGDAAPDATSNNAVLTVNSPPAITSQPMASTIGAGSNTTFSVTAANATGYQWQVDQGAGFGNISDGGVYSGAMTSTLTITGATAGMSGYLYRVVASGLASPNAVSNNASLTVNSPPAITFQPMASTIAAGANTTFSVTAANATGYQWQVDQGAGFNSISNGGVYSGATTATLTITGATAGMSGYLYRVVATGAANPAATSNSAALTVQSPPSITGEPSDSTVTRLGDTSFTATASNATSYQWQVNTGSGFADLSNGGVYSGVTTQTLSITSAPTSLNGYQYRLVATGAVAPAATSNAATLTVNPPAPEVTNVTPSIGSTNGGTEVTIAGVDFTGATSVTFDGVAATSFNVDSASQITATTPARVTPGTVAVRVTTPYGTNTTGSFEYVLPPSASSQTVSSGPTAGGTSVTLSGSGFSQSTVTVGGANASVTGYADNYVTFTTPAGVAGAADIVVTAPGGALTLSGSFTYIAAPTISSFTPSYGPTAGGTSVTVSGSGLLGATVEIEGPGGIEHTATVTGSGANSLTFTTPAATAGVKGIIVTTPGGQFRSLTPFTYFAPPTISHISPDTGLTAGGTSVTITGTNFTNPGVTIGGLSAVVTASSATSLTVTTPAGAAGAADVVITDFGGSVTLVGGFVYTLPAPQITSDPSGSAISVGGDTSFTATASNATSYQWQVDTGSGFGDLTNGGVYSGATTATLTITGATADMNGYQYRMVASGATAPDAISNAATLSVNKLSQTVSFTSTAPVGAVIGDTYAVTASASSSLLPAITVDAGSVAICSIAGGTVTFNAAGTCRLNADQAGDSTYAAAAQVQQVIIVGLASQTVAFTSTAPVGAVIGDTYAVTASASSSLLPEIAVDAGSVAICSIASGTVTFNAAGTCRLNADQGGDSTYAAATQVQQDITVGLASQTVSFTSTAPVGAVVGDTYVVTASASSSLAPVITVDAGSVAICSISGGTVTFNAAGTCTLNANQAGDSTYAAATQVQQDITVGLASQTVAFTSTAPVGAVIGDTYAVTATATSSLLPVITVDAGSAAICSISGGTVTFNAAGTCTLNANQAGDSTYAAAAQVQQDITVGLASQTVAFTSTAPVGAAVGDTYAVTATASSSLLPVITVDAGSVAICSIASGTVTFNAAGTCTLNANQAGDSTYAAATQVQQDITVGLAAQTVAFTSTAPVGAVVGDTYAVTASASSALTPVITVDAGSVAICSIAGGTVTFNAAGTCTLNANQAGDSTYAAATQVQQDITVGLASQTVAFTSTAPVGAVVGDTYAVTASASSALTPVITVDAGSVAICSIAGGTVTFNATGTCTLNADQAGDSTYAAATQVQQDITVGLAAPQISGLTPNTSGNLGGTTTIISGSHLLGATSVTIGGKPAISFTVNSDSQITVVVPSGTVGAADVVVTTPVDSFTLSGGFTYTQSNQALESFATVAANSVDNVIVPDTVGETPDSFSIYMAPQNGTATVSGATILYTPNAGFSGQDRIFFSALKGGQVFSSSPPVWITVTAPVLSVTPAAGNLPEAVAGTAYNATLSASAGQAPYSYVLKDGALPNGLSLDGATGIISGAPTETGNFSFTITASDVNLATGDAAYSLSVIPAVSTDATLSGLVLSDGALSPAFASGTTSYIVSVANGVSSLTLTPAATDANATLTVNGTPVTSGQTSAAIPLNVGLNTIPVVVTAEDGTTIRTYTLSVTRAALSTNASLSGLTLSEGALSPAFASGTTSYSATVENAVSSLTLTPAAADTNATLTVNGTTVASGQTSAAIPLNVGLNTIPVVVTAEDGTTLRTYTLSVTRSSLLVATPGAGALAAGVANEAYTTTLSVSGGVGPYGFAVTSGALPDGLTLDASTGTISGVPETDGSYAFTITVTDANNASAQFSYSLNIAVPPAPEVSNPDTTSMPANTSTQAGQSVNMNLSELVQGQYDDIQIVTQPQHGTVALIRTPAVQGGGLPALALAISSLSAPEQIVAVYTPEANYQGSDSFQFVAVGPGGVSSPATVMIEVQGTLPTAPSRTVTVIDGQTVAVELTEGATDGPFTGATIVSVTPEDAATVRIIEGGAANNRTYRMEITPEARFSGNIAVAYTLSNAFGESAPAMVTANVTARPDPSSDPAVRAISDAQVETARRFSRAQVANFMRRAESLHGQDCGRSGSTVQLSAQSRPDGPRYEGDTEYLKDDRYRQGEDQQPLPGHMPRDANTPSSNGSAPSAAGERCANRFAVWVGGTIDLSTYDALSDRSKISASTSGLSIGMDRKIREGLIVGAGLGFGSDRSRIASGAAHVSSESKVAAVYGSYTLSPDVFVDAVILHGRLNFDTRRTDATTNLTVRGERDGWFTTGAVSVGFERKRGPLFWSVYSRGEYMTGSLDAYREQGAGIYDLRFDERDLRSFTGVLGFRGSYDHEVSYGLIKAGLRAEWQHEFADSTDQRLDYADIAGPAFYGLTTRGWAREQYLITPSLELTLPSGWQMGLEVGLRTAGKENSSSATFQLQKPF